MAEVPPKPAADGSRRIYVLWGVGLGLLTALALVCWLVVGPVTQVRRLADLHRQGRLTESEVVAQLGGQERAVSKLLLHLRVALKIISADRYRYTSDVLEVLCCCEVPASPAPFRDLRVVMVLLLNVDDGRWASGRSVEEVKRARTQRERRQRWADWFMGRQPPAPLPAGQPTPRE